MEPNDFLPAAITLKDLLQQEHISKQTSIVTFSQSLDAILGGSGIICGQIIEIFGDKGIGKTTFCIQLALNVQIPKVLKGLEGEAIYIDTENTLAFQRVRSMAQELTSHCLKLGVELPTESLLQRINYLKCENLHHFNDILDNLDEYLKFKPAIKLIIIDSLAFLFYSEKENFREMYRIGKSLHTFVRKHNVGIVITNNMTTRFEEDSGEIFVPYFGESWHHIPNQRVYFRWLENCRVAELIKCSTLPTALANYRIIHGGIRD